MHILGPICLILGFAYAGEILALLIPFGLPASVLGLLLLLAALKLRLVKPEYIGDSAQVLSSNMAFFFIPSAVSIINTYGIISPVIIKLIIICLLSTLFTFLASYGGVRIVQIIMKKNPPARNKHKWKDC